MMIFLHIATCIHIHIHIRYKYITIIPNFLVFNSISSIVVEEEEATVDVIELDNVGCGDEKHAKSTAATDFSRS